MEPDCPSCPYQHQQRVRGVDLDRGRIVVGMAPGTEEVLQATPFIGPTGDMVRGLLNGTDVGFTNAVECFPGRQPDKTKYEVARKCCLPRLEAELAGKDVLVLGGDATRSVSGRQRAITKFRGTEVLGEFCPADEGEFCPADEGEFCPADEGEALRDTWTGDLGTRRAVYSLHPAFVLRQGGLATNAGIQLKGDVRRWAAKDKQVKAEILINPKRLKLPPKGTPVVIDIETTGLDEGAPDARIKCYGFAWRDPQDSREAPGGDDPRGAGVVARAPDTLRTVVYSRVTPTVRRLLDGRYPLIAQNHAFEVRWLERHGPKGSEDIKGWSPGLYRGLTWHDTMLLAHALHEDRGEESDTRAGYGLDALTEDFLPLGFPGKEELGGWDQEGEDLYTYCGWDCIKELLLWERWCKEVHDARHFRVRVKDGDVQSKASSGYDRYNAVALPGARFLDRVERRGMPFDRERCGEVLAELERDIAKGERKLKRFADINWGSAPQVRRAFRELGLKPSGLKTDGGQHALHKLARAGLRALNPEHTKMLEVWDEVARGKKTLSMLRGPKGPINYVRDGRIHARLSIVGTATGRLSASRPPIHNLHPPIRRCFVAPKGYVFLAADYAGSEVGWMAHYSGDERLVQLALSGKSLHDEVAAGLDVSRPVAKRINFAMGYGGGAPALKRQLDETHWGEYDEPACQQLAARRRGLFPVYQSWFAEQGRFAAEHGYAISDTGWVRRLPAAQGEAYGEAYGEAMRQAGNTPVQNISSDTTIIRGMECERITGLQIVLLKHDEILALVPKRSARRAAREMKTIMENPDFYWGSSRVPLRVDFKVGPSWGEMEDLEI